MDEKTLRDLFTQCDVGWVFEGLGDEFASARARHVLDEMAALQQKFADAVGRPLGQPLDELILSDISHFKPLVQSLASSMTTPMRTMILCLLDGAHIKSIKFDYEFERSVRLEVEVEYDTGQGARFASNEVWDAEVLKHVGVFKMGNAPVIDGYYAFRGSTS